MLEKDTHLIYTHHSRRQEMIIRVKEFWPKNANAHKQQQRIFKNSKIFKINILEENPILILIISVISSILST